MYEVSLADLDKDADDKSFRKFRLIAEDIQGRDVLLNFHGLNFATDKIRSLVKKWHTQIEVVTDAKTTDGYLLRVFGVAYTKKAAGQIAKTSYAQGSQTRQIRAKMSEIISREVTSVELKNLVPKLKAETIGQDIEKAVQV